jgi:hypothetical protein
LKDFPGELNELFDVVYPVALALKEGGYTENALSLFDVTIVRALANPLVSAKILM